VPPSSIDNDLSNLIALFTERLEAVGGHVHRASDPESLAELIAEIAGAVHEIWVSTDVATAAPELTLAIGAAGFDVRIPNDPATVRDQPIGLALARAAIAETGSAILVEPRVNDRAVTLMTQTLVVICPESAIVPSLDEAAGILREISRDRASYTTFITGPSRTADIERELTVGVQGPGVLHVLLTSSLSSDRVDES